MKYTYLLVNFFALIVPLLFSFYPSIRFYRTWKFFLPAMLLSAALFLAWDVWFTSMGVWSFNENYVTGVYLWGLPLEEILFFICIPYACVFTYFCLDQFFSLAWKPASEKNFAALLSLLLILLAVVFRDRWYTVVTFASTGLFCLFLVFVQKINWFGKAVTVYAVLLLPFFIVNGILTGTGPDQPVVMYNDAENLGIRMFTIPVEDAFYGFELFLLNLFLMKWLQKSWKAESSGKYEVRSTKKEFERVKNEE